jgi:hypothetical protein
MQEEHVSQIDSVVLAQAVDQGRRNALVRLGTYSALAAPAMMTLLAEPSAADGWKGSGGGGKGGGGKKSGGGKGGGKKGGGGKRGGGRGR